MSETHRKQIYETLDQKPTSELLDIWVTNNRIEWINTTFEVLAEILQERLGTLPVQNEPITELVEEDREDRTDPRIQAFLSEETAPALYQPQEVLMLDLWLKRVAIASVILSVASGLFTMPNFQRIVWSYSIFNPAWNALSWIISFGIVAIISGVQAIFLYLSMRGLGLILRILMEMEFNTRT